MKHTSEQFVQYVCVCVCVFYGLKDASLYNLICPQCEHGTQPLVPPLPHCKHVVGAYGTCVYGIFN